MVLALHPPKNTRQWVDKYRLTFSQWHKSSAAAGFETACGVVTHFKKVLRGPHWGHGKQRHTACPLRWTSLREVTSFFLCWSSSDPPWLSHPDPNETVSVCICPFLLHHAPWPQLSGFICSHLSPPIYRCLSTVVSTVSGSLRLQITVI